MSGFDSPTLDATIAECEAHEAAALARSTPKPCPFCGSEDVNLEEADVDTRWNQAECVQCGAQGPDVLIGLSEDGEQRTLDAWNRRKT